MATPLAVVLTELLQNVVDHAYPVGDDVEPADALVEMGSDAEVLTVRVVDDGVGLPSTFDKAGSSGLGLQIVRSLVETELAGTITMSSGDGPEGRRGTSIELVVPIRRGWPAAEEIAG
jgi:two-component sensor histidine kinase